MTEINQELAGKYLKEEFDERVLKKINLLQNQHVANIDIEKIKADCRNEIMREVENSINENVPDVSLFFAQLQTDDSEFLRVLESRAVQRAEEAAVDPSKLTDQSNPFMSKEEINKLVQYGVKWMEDKDYAKGLLYFGFLTTVDPQNPEIWYHKGASEQGLLKYDDALKSYLTMTMLEPNNILPIVGMMQCLTLANRIDEAKQIYDGLVNAADPSVFEGDSSIAEKLRFIKKYINGEMVIPS